MCRFLRSRRSQADRTAPERTTVHIVIMGCGRVGSTLAHILEDKGHSVAIIDQSPEAFRRLRGGFKGRRITGFGFDRDVLVEAGIEHASAFVAVSSGDNSNIISARVVRETFGIDRVVARIYDAKRAAVYERLGIPTVATVPWSTDRLMRMLLPDGVASAWREPNGTVAILPLPLHEDWVGHPVRALEQAAGCRVAFIVRFGTGVLPHADTIVQHEDTIYVAAVSGTVSEVTAAASAPPQEG